MKVGDLVRLRALPGPRNSGNPGVIVKLFKKKCWRTSEHGRKIDWNIIEPELHAEVLINENILSVPAVELEVVNESR